MINLRHKLNELELTVEEIAKELNAEHYMVEDWINSKTVPPPQCIANFCELLDIGLTELFKAVEYQRRSEASRNAVRDKCKRNND
ncbi:helix-turn-helix transcriptional regulator [Erysipelotrichaceae bacterium OttesenSCG-928-M19]|nr:helix-turn-helix transcriptional regulator [Erysipelotrichaceae bacterium OttesenSCG-928-M19]